MKKVKLNQSVLIPKRGTFAKDQAPIVSDEYAIHLVENMNAGEIVEDISADEVPDPLIEATQESIIVAIAQIDETNDLLWTADGKPTVEALEDMLDKKVSADQRDKAFAEFIQQ